MKEHKFELLCGPAVLEEVNIARGEEDRGYGVTFRVSSAEIGGNERFYCWVPVERPYPQLTLPEWDAEEQLARLTSFLLTHESVEIYKEETEGETDQGTPVSIDGGLKICSMSGKEPVDLLGPAWQRIR